jgi:tRNA-specific 2-thiouridylase
MSHPRRVALGLSGGVDSAVVAKLLLAEGYDVTAVFMECWREPGCRAEQDRQDALKVALQLGLPFQGLDFRQAYQDQVMSYFLREYQAGRTPNPDVLCNKEIKFGLFYNWAMEAGFDAIATGHYAQILPTNSDPNQLGLFAAADAHKDQTYFLHLLKSEQLSNILFPIGHLQKTEVRKLAQEWQLPVASKPDSVGICFVGEINVRDFLLKKLGTNPGQIVTETGKVIGKHEGLWFYTVGQRHGFNINTTQFFADQPASTVNKQQLPPLYVIAKKPATNTLVVGLQQAQNQMSFAITASHWLTTPQPEDALLVRIRHTGELVPCQLTLQGETGKVRLTNTLSGISAGQFAVFYKSPTTAQKKTAESLECLGGGVITD